jgi:uncharacterized protein (TIGR02246 family)
VRYITLVSVIMLVAIAGCRTQPAVDIDAEITTIKDLLAEYVRSVETEDMELYARLVSHDTTMVNFGSFGRPIRGWNGLVKVMEGQNELLSDTKIAVSDLKIYVSADGKTAWARCLWVLKAKMADNPVELPVRCTWVFEKDDAGWKIVHFHKSLPAG